LSFLLLPGARPTSLPIPRTILPAPMSSSKSSPVVPDYMVKPPVTQFYSRRGAHLSDVPASSDALSSDVPSSSFIKFVPSSPVEPSFPEQLVRRSHRLRRAPDCYSSSAFTATALSESVSYHEAILHPEWQYVMAEEITTLVRADMWDLVHCPSRVCLIICK
jgi:hypothetical protein